MKRTTLHLVAFSPADSNQFHQLLQVVGDDDAVLLLQDACWLLQERQKIGQLGCPCYVLRSDFEARRLSAGDCAVIDYPAFVGLVATYDRSVSWS